MGGWLTHLSRFPPLKSSSSTSRSLKNKKPDRAGIFCLSFGVRPKGWTGLGGSFDRLPSVVVLELRGAQVAER